MLQMTDIIFLLTSSFFAWIYFEVMLFLHRITLIAVIFTGCQILNLHFIRTAVAPEVQGDD